VKNWVRRRRETNVKNTDHDSVLTKVFDEKMLFISCELSVQKRSRKKNAPIIPVSTNG